MPALFVSETFCQIGSIREAPVRSLGASNSSTRFTAMAWYRVRQISRYTTADQAVEEFQDEDFVSNWSAGEFVILLVACAGEDQASVLAREEQTSKQVNVYGQEVVHEVLWSSEPEEIESWQAPPDPDAEHVVEVDSLIVNGVPGTDWLSEFRSGLPFESENCPMINPIVFYEHRDRFEEIRRERGLPPLGD